MGLLVLNGGNVLSPAGMTSFYIGSGNNTNGKVLVNSGSLNVKGTDTTIANGGNSIGVLDVEGGSVLSGTLNAGSVDKNIVINSGATTGSALLSVSGSGTITTAGLIFGAGIANATTYNFTTGAAAFNQTGGSVYIGSNGIALGANVNNLTPTITLSGGTIGATAAWSSTLKMTLNSGVTTFKAANADGSVNSNITLGGRLTGVGKLAKTGGGILLLTAVNDYQGGTIISAGILQTDAVGTLGSGTVFVDSTGTLILGNSASIDSMANLSFVSGASINLAFADTLTLDSLYSGSNYLSAGTYTVTDLNNYFGGSTFSGTGSIIVTSMIPEPSTFALLLVGAGVLAVSVRKRV
jgi:autotransporter-associated beta strand protein